MRVKVFREQNRLRHSTSNMGQQQLLRDVRVMSALLQIAINVSARRTPRPH
jgi:hypothetical protein